MRNTCERSFTKLLLLAVLIALSPTLVTAQILNRPTTTPIVWAEDKTEDQLIKDLASKSSGVVVEALVQLERRFPIGTNALPIMRKLLADPRDKVRCKAARVLGALHAEVDATDIKNICELLKSSEPNTQIDGLKALRGLKASDAVAEIIPLLICEIPTVARDYVGQHGVLIHRVLLNSQPPNVVRDACRTLAVLGDKSAIPSIEPLLKDSNPAVQKDAMDAINALKAKP